MIIKVTIPLSPSGSDGGAHQVLMDIPTAETFQEVLEDFVDNGFIIGEELWRYDPAKSRPPESGPIYYKSVGQVAIRAMTAKFKPVEDAEAAFIRRSLAAR